jgi:hypothetical protein
MVFSATTNVFSDAIVTAKEFNRQPERILDLAVEGPVTITRNSEAFALLPREKVTALVRATQVTNLALEVTSIAYRLMEGEKVSVNHPYAWLMEFDRDDLKDFINDVTRTFEEFVNLPNAWFEMGGIIYEWHESSLIAASGVLDDLLTES